MHWKNTVLLVLIINTEFIPFPISNFRLTNESKHPDILYPVCGQYNTALESFTLLYININF